MAHTKKILGLGGLATAGKDTLADALVAAGGWTKIGMSDALWRVLRAMDPMVSPGIWLADLYAWALRQHGNDPDAAYTRCKTDPEVRRLLQRLGTEGGRHILGQDVWVTAMLKAVAEADTPGVVVTGVRHPNEVWALREAGALLVWVDRPGVEPVHAHSSEKSVGHHDFDRVLRNDGTPEDLYQKYLRAIEE